MMSLSKAFEIMRSTLNKPFSPIDILTVSILYSGFLAWFAMDRTITIYDGGFRVFLIRYSWFVGLLLLNNVVWLTLSIIKDWRFRHLHREKLNIHLFVFSHVVMAMVLVSDFLHFLLFGVHWNPTSISTAYYGILVGSAPLGLQYAQIIFFVIALTIFFYISLFIVKLFPKMKWVVTRKFHTRVLAGMVATVLLLIVIQRVIPPNWHSEQIQKLIPFFQFVQPLPQYPEIDEKFSGYGDVKNQQKELLKKLEVLERSMEVNLRDIERYNITVVHVEALRHDLLNNENLPNIYQFVQNGAEALPNHYSSSNNTVGSIFGLVTGLSGPLYQHHRDEPIHLPAISLFQKMGYQLSLFTSSAMTYQNALGYVFYDFNNHEFVGRGNVVEDKAMLDTYLQSINEPSDKPRFDYVIFNSIHFPYVYPDEFNKFQPVVEQVGLSYRANERQHLEENKIGLKNRFYNSALYIDELIGQLISGLERSNYFEDGILVIVGDHGQEFWEHNRFGHSWSLVDEQTKVTAVIKAPTKINHGFLYSSHSDILPSIFHALGLDDDVLALFTGKALQNYEKNKDFVTIGSGVMGTQKPSKAAVVGNGLKIQYYYNPEIEVESITDSGDDILNDFQEYQVENLIHLSLSESTKLGFNYTK